MIEVPYEWIVCENEQKYICTGHEEDGVKCHCPKCVQDDELDEEEEDYNE